MSRKTIRTSGGDVACTIDDDGCVRDKYGTLLCEIKGTEVYSDGGAFLGSYRDGEFRNKFGALAEPKDIVGAILGKHL